jgi:hypothetical protein
VGFRRSPGRIAARQAWRRFVERNAKIVSATGLPSDVTASIAAWDQFLIHGTTLGGLTVGQLTPVQYASLVELAANYFAAGYEFYAPRALSVEDQEVLSARFEGGH